MSDNKKGMLRRVDVLGRVVIPREVRKALKINCGDLMEFCACSNKQVVIRKFHLIREIVPLAKQIVDVARAGNECDIAILDSEKLVCWNGETTGELGTCGDDMRDMMEQRKAQIVEDLRISTKKTVAGKCCFQPILCDGDVLGAVVVGATDTATAERLAKLIAEFVASYFAE